VIADALKLTTQKWKAIWDLEEHGRDGCSYTVLLFQRAIKCTFPCFILKREITILSQLTVLYTYSTRPAYDLAFAVR